MPLPRLLREQALTGVPVTLTPAQWRTAVAILVSAQSIMESGIHTHAAQVIIDQIVEQAGVHVTPVKTTDG